MKKSDVIQSDSSGDFDMKKPGFDLDLGLELFHDAEAAHLEALFSYGFMPPDFQEVSNDFAHLAEKVALLPVGFERNMALRKLLEAKDCAVRTLIGRKP